MGSPTLLVSAAVRRGAIIRMTALAVLLAVVTGLVAVLIPWLPESAGEEMDRIIFTFWFATIICIVIFAVVGAVILYSVLAFRAQPEDDTDGPPIHGHTGLEIVWTVIPAVLVIAIGIVSAVVLAQNGDAGSNPNQIKVVAQQFAWRFEYEDGKVKAGRPQAATRSDHEARHRVARRDPRVLGATARTEDRRRPRDHDDDQRHADETRDLPDRLHRALRARARNDARHRRGGQPGRLRRLARRAAGGVTGRRRRRRGDLRERGLWRLPRVHPGRITGRGSGRTSTTSEPRGADFVRESIVDPDATVAPGYQPGIMPTNYGGTLSDEQLEALVAFLGGES